jgi:hypothetical protein
MAEQNFSAAVRMTLPSVVRNYLRWFELARHKQALRHFGGSHSLPGWRPFPLGSAFPRFSPSRSRDGSLNTALLLERWGISNGVDDPDGNRKA